jgi:hypothetical protein
VCLYTVRPEAINRLRSREKWFRNETGDSLPHLAVLWRKSLFFLPAESEPIVFEYSTG